ncbi:MAG: hypothetical protein RLZZ630_828 [Bacteroidota bacterium]|jgi:copper chaperone CopZ
MKKTFGLILASLIAQYATAQSDTIRIVTSAQCETCREKLSRDLGYLKGVEQTELDLDTRILQVIYDSGRTTPEKIRKAVTRSGYDADDLPADPRAYQRLPGCCKKGGHPRE